MTQITQSEQGAAGRFINLGSAASLDDLGPTTVIAYCSLAAAPTAAAYLFGKATAASWSRFVVTATSTLGYAKDSSGTANAPDRAAGAVNVAGTAQHLQFDWDGTVNAANINLYIDAGVAITGGATVNGTGAVNSDAAGDLFLLNRSGLGREFVGKLFYLAQWNRILTAAERTTARADGPLAVPSGLVLCYANGRDYSTFAHPVVSRSTFVDGGLPPNVTLGPATNTNITVGLVAEDAIIAGSISVAGTSNITVGLVGEDAIIAGSISVAMGTITSGPLKDNQNVLHPNEALNYVAIYDLTTGALVVRLTGLSTNGAGVFTATHSLIIPGTSYRVDWELASNKRRMPIGLAA